MRYILITRRALSIGLVLILAAAFVLAGVSNQYASGTAAQAQSRRLPVYCVETAEKKVAITFDAAWGAEDTAELLEILAEFNAHVTVFAVGDWVRKYPESVKAFYDAGHTIGNHSDSHKAYSELTYDELLADMEACSAAIESCTGARPRVLRAPSGDYTDDTITAAEALGMQTVQWSVDSLDWQGLSVEEMVERVTAATENGSILLFHNDVKNTPDALREILRILSEEGYSFVTVEELIYWKDYRINSAGRQYANAA